MTRRIFEIRKLSLRNGRRFELEDFSISVEAGDSITILGECGSGIDALARVLTRVTGRGDQLHGIQFGDGDRKALARRIKPGARIAYLCGASGSPLNPSASVVAQLVRVAARGGSLASGKVELRAALERFSSAPSFESLDRKPQELKPVELAFALLATAAAQTPELLIADHAFDGLTPIAIAALARDLMNEQKRQGFALICLTRDLQTAVHLRGRMMVLRGGKIVEEGDFDKLASGQSHAYTRALFKSLPSRSQTPCARNNRSGDPLLQVQGLDLETRRRGDDRAPDGLSFKLRHGAALALVGDEGSGRGALVRAMLGLDPVTNGRVVFDQVDISLLSTQMKSRLRRRIAFINGSDDVLDPRMTLVETLDNLLHTQLRLPRDAVAASRDAALRRVGLASRSGRVATLSRFDKRRLQVARAIASAPVLAVIDEPLLGLDAYAQSIMLELFRDLRKHEAPALLVITADLRVAQAIADDVIVFKQGRVVERGPIAGIIRAPKDAETRRLLAAALPYAADEATQQTESATPEPATEPQEAAILDILRREYAVTESSG